MAMNAPIAALAFASFLMAVGVARPAPAGADATLQSLIGKDRATIERRIGLPDESENNGVQVFMHYHSFDSWRLGTGGSTFGDSKGFGDDRGFRGRANFDCQMTIVLTDGIMRAYTRNGIGCR
jgi:hypothetical protein